MGSFRQVAGLFLCMLVAVAEARPADVAGDMPPLSAYGRLPAMDHVMLSPSGERFAFEASVQGKRMLFVRTVDGQPLAVSGLDGVKLREISWAGEDFVIVKISDTVDLGWFYGQQNELNQLLAIDLRSGTTRSLLKNNRVMNASFGEHGYVRRDGRWYGYFTAVPITRSTFSRQAYLQTRERLLVEVALDSGELRTVDRGSHQQLSWVLDERGGILANERYDDARGRWTLHAGGDQRRRLADIEDRIGRHFLLGRGRTADSVIYRASDEEENLHVVELGLDGEQRTPVVPPDTPVRNLHFDPEDRLLRGYVSEGDYPSLQLFDPERQRHIEAARRAFPGRYVSVYSVSRDARRIVVHTSGSGDAGSWWLVDIDRRRADPLGDAYPGIAPSQVGPVSMVDYTASDGLPLRGVLTLPPGRGDGRPPVIALPHGGPEARDYPAFHWIAQAFASRGYAVWQPNFRGSAGYGTALRRAGYGEWGRRMQSDISDGIAALGARGLVDPRRACIVGASYGGYAALAGVTLQQGQYRCAVAFAGVSDLAEFLADRRQRYSDNVRRYFERFIGASGTLFDREIHERSPARQAARADAPVLLIHGRDDVVVPLAQSKAMERALRRAGKPVELVILDSEDHWLSREPTRQQTLEAAVVFVQRHLPASPPTIEE